MKTLKFAPELIPLVLSGEKTSTWRLFDDKDLSEGDSIILIDSATKKHFATANIISAIKKPLGELEQNDWIGHERFGSEAKMYQKYREYYNTQVTPQTLVKIIKFELL